MIHEKSCGAVIYTETETGRNYLIETMRQGHVSLCKGHVEGRENEHETARREIREETALEIRFVEGFRETTEYSPYPGCRKEVVFFLAEALGTETCPQEAEVRALSWLPLAEALAALTYESDRAVLTRAGQFLDGTPCGE